MDKIVTFTITITINKLNRGYTTMISSPHDSTTAFWNHRTNITEITLANEINLPPNFIESWDVSTNQDGSLMAYIVDDGLGTNTYHLHIQGDGIIYANSNSNYVFYNFNKLKKINNFHYFNTANATAMLSFFFDCRSLEEIDLSNFDTSNATSFFQMFMNCYTLTNLDLSNFNTSKVTNLQRMFQNCNKLTTLDLTNFDTSKVTTMNQMFDGCLNLVTLNVNGFTTEVLTNVSNMFYNCNNLSTLEINSGDFSSITTHTNMFSYVKDGINITVKDANNVTWFTQRLTEAGKTGNVTI